MPKKFAIVDRFGAPIQVLDEQQPHTLPEFVEESLRYGIFPEGLPEGLLAEEAARRFKEMSQVKLKPVSYGENYFHGWSPAGGKPVVTDDGQPLFTIFAELRGGGIGYRLRIEPAGLALLSQSEPSPKS